MRSSHKRNFATRCIYSCFLTAYITLTAQEAFSQSLIGTHTPIDASCTEETFEKYTDILESSISSELETWSVEWESLTVALPFCGRQAVPFLRKVFNEIYDDEEFQNLQTDWDIGSSSDALILGSILTIIEEIATEDPFVVISAFPEIRVALDNTFLSCLAIDILKKNNTEAEFFLPVLISMRESFESSNDSDNIPECQLDIAIAIGKLGDLESASKYLIESIRSIETASEAIEIALALRDLNIQSVDLSEELFKILEETNIQEVKIGALLAISVIGSPSDELAFKVRQAVGESNSSVLISLSFALTTLGAENEVVIPIFLDSISNLPDENTNWGYPYNSPIELQHIFSNNLGDNFSPYATELIAIANDSTNQSLESRYQSLLHLSKLQLDKSFIEPRLRFFLVKQTCEGVSSEDLLNIENNCVFQDLQRQAIHVLEEVEANSQNTMSLLLEIATDRENPNRIPAINAIRISASDNNKEEIIETFLRILSESQENEDDFLTIAILDAFGRLGRYEIIIPKLLDIIQKNQNALVEEQFENNSYIFLDAHKANIAASAASALVNIGEPALSYLEQSLFSLESEEAKSAAYVLSKYRESTDIIFSSGITEKLFEVVLDDNKNIDLRRLSAYALFDLDYNVDSFYEESGLLPPNKIACFYDAQFDSLTGICAVPGRNGGGGGELNNFPRR